MNKNELKISLAQINVSDDKTKNLENAERAIKLAAEGGSSLVVLPEAFNCPYATSFLVEAAETIPDGATCRMLSRCARECGIYIAGSLPEVDKTGKRFNTCPVFNPEGEMIAKHRKMFMAITDASDKMVFDEARIFDCGNELTTFEIQKNDITCRVGIGVCRDVRYPEVALAYRQLGCHLVVYPGAFNPAIGEDHYELLHRSRALDSQIYVAAVCPARDETASFVAYGNSMLLDPWGQIVCRAGDAESLLTADIDLDYLSEIRRALPLSRKGTLSTQHLGLFPPPPPPQSASNGLSNPSL